MQERWPCDIDHVIVSLFCYLGYSSSSLLNAEKDPIRKIDHDKIINSFANMPTLQKQARETANKVNQVLEANGK